MRYNENEVLRTLSKHNAIDVNKKKITVSGNVGIGTWGKIDFLRNYHGYWVVTQ